MSQPGTSAVTEPAVDWVGRVLPLRLGAAGHGGFCVARHDGRVVFVRYGLPGELVRARVTEDRGRSFCRAEAVEILEADPHRVPATCLVAGPGGAGCCDFSFVTTPRRRELLAGVVVEQLRRLADWCPSVEVEPISGSHLDTGWRSRVRLAVDSQGRAGVHRYRSDEVIADLRCPQPAPGSLSGIAERSWTAGAELVVVVDDDGLRHIVEGRPKVEGGPKTQHGRVVEGSGRAVQYVGRRRWEVAATGFWQPHRDAAQCYSDVVAQWAQPSGGELVWDLYSGAGVFAARLAAAVGPDGAVHAVDSQRSAVADGAAAVVDLPWLRMHARPVQRWLREQHTGAPDVVVMDPPRAGAGRAVITAVADAAPRRIVHIGCDPAAFARDVSLYRGAGYQPTRLRVFDAFPGTHHIECLALLERTGNTA